MKRIPITRLRDTLRKRVEAVYADNERFVITRRGYPVAALISIKDFRERFPEEEEKDTT